MMYPTAYPPPAPAAAAPATGLDEEDDDPTIAGSAAAAAAAAGRKGNVLPVWGNGNTMNINPLILTNIQGSPYFKVSLFEHKTYHEVVDEIYYRVEHLEPWERGSRKTSGQTGMCGGVRGVGAGGIVSSAYCLLYKLFTLRLTRKQLNGLLNHCDSPYIRGIGLMYIRYCQPPSDFWDWYSPYFEDEEEIDIKAGGGMTMTIGQLARNMLEKLEWFDTRFPRIPVNVQKQINEQLNELYPNQRKYPAGPAAAKPATSSSRGPSRSRDVSRDPEEDKRRRRSRSKDRRRSRSRSKERRRSRSRSKDRKRSRSRSKDKKKKSKKERRRSRSRSRSPKKKHKKHKKDDGRRRSRSASRDRGGRSRRSRSRSPRSKEARRDRRDGSPKSYADELRQYSDDRGKAGKHKKKHKRSRSRSR